MSKHLGFITKISESTPKKALSCYKGHKFSIDKEKYSTIGEEELYKIPSRILNSNIVKFENSRVYLKENLQEIYDYIVVDYYSWILLSGWYGYDYSVPVKMPRQQSE